MSGVMQLCEFEQAVAALGASTDAEIARRVGVHRSTVSRWRSGKVVVSKPWARIIRTMVSEARNQERNEL